MKPYLAIIFMSIISLSMAQTDTIENKLKRKEFHLRIQNFSPFSIGIAYKQQVKPKGYFVVSLVNLGFGKRKKTPNQSFNYPQKITQASAGLTLGYEFRKELKKKFTIYHGPNIGYTYSLLKNEIDNPNILERINKVNNHSALINYNVGFMYQFHKNILASAQISPQFRYTRSIDKNGSNITKEDDYNFSFSNLAGTLAIVFRFNE